MAVKNDNKIADGEKISFGNQRNFRASAQGRINRFRRVAIAAISVPFADPKELEYE